MNEKAVDLALKVAQVTRERDEARAELARIVGLAESALRFGVLVHPSQILDVQAAGS